MSLLEAYEPAGELMKRNVINPQAPVKVVWDLLVSLAILGSVIQLPVVVGFQVENTPALVALDWVMTVVRVAEPSQI